MVHLLYTISMGSVRAPILNTLCSLFPARYSTLGATVFPYSYLRTHLLACFPSTGS